MKLGKPVLRAKKGRVAYEVSVGTQEASRTLWYSVPSRFEHLIAATSDCALVALLVPAMARGEDLHVAGTVSEKLYYNLDTLQAILVEVMPLLREIRVHPEDVDSSGVRAEGVATGFSGGVDSFSALADHYYLEVLPTFKITHLLSNNVGSHERGGEALFRRRFERLLPLAERLGLPFVDVNSNLDEFYTMNHQQTHTTRNASVALLLGCGIGRFLYASTYRFRDAFVGPYHDSAASELVTLPLLSTERTECFSVGSQYSRVQKTLHVAELADARDFLDVCMMNAPGTNCSVCPKCKRTLFTLELAGKLDRFEKVFDLAAYKKARQRYIGRALFLENDPFSREIAEFAAEVKFKPPLSSRLFAEAVRARDWVRSLSGPSTRAF